MKGVWKIDNVLGDCNGMSTTCQMSVSMTCSYCSNPAVSSHSFCGRIACFARWFVLESQNSNIVTDDALTAEKEYTASLLPSPPLTDTEVESMLAEQFGT